MSRRAGALYFSSAGNSGNLNDGTSGVWEGDFVAGGAAGAPVDGRDLSSLHRRAGLQHPHQSRAPARSTCSGRIRSARSGNDYDLFRLNSRGHRGRRGLDEHPGRQRRSVRADNQQHRQPARGHREEDRRGARFLHLNANRGTLLGRDRGPDARPRRDEQPFTFDVAAMYARLRRPPIRSAPPTSSRPSAPTVRAGSSTPATARRSRRGMSRRPAARCCRSPISPPPTACSSPAREISLASSSAPPRPRRMPPRSWR